MKEKNLEAHLFICTNQKEKGACCNARGAQELRNAVKAFSQDSAHASWKGRVRVNNSGCLGHCEEGIVAVLYPQGQWFTGLQATDHKILEEALESALK